MANSDASVHVIAPHTSPEQAAAIIVAVQRFRSDTAQGGVLAEPAIDQWTQAALIDAVQSGDVSSSNWTDRPPWS